MQKPGHIQIYAFYPPQTIQGLRYLLWNIFVIIIIIIIIIVIIIFLVLWLNEALIKT